MTLLIYVLLVIIAEELIPGLETTYLYFIGVIVWISSLWRK